MIVTRFAPSPNGPLHLGHAYSAIIAHDLAAAGAALGGGRFVLRIEDIDGIRSREELAQEFRQDLEWLGLGQGLGWEEVPAQSARLTTYAAAANRLRGEGLLYPCRCTRAEILAAATDIGPNGPLYPGTCKHQRLAPDEPVAWRLDVEEAMRRTGPLVWYDALAGAQAAQPDLLGDVVLVRRDVGTPASYHLAATLDDAADGVTLVTRGRDLFAASHVHRLLQGLLDLPVPQWHHHGLLLDNKGKKLAKRRSSPSLSERRAGGEDGLGLAQRLRMDQMPGGITLSR